MMSLKPIFLFKYLGFKKNIVPKNIGRLFYLSWEDALWDILIKKKIKKGSTILVPEFFCGDVEENIKNHGYKVSYFSVDSRLTTSPKQLIDSIAKYSPEVIVILHSIGISNQLFIQNYWVKYLRPDTILIEDSVHKIVDPTEVEFIKSNHFIIDSLRKVIPLQGSVVYAQKNDLNFSEPSLFQSWKYGLDVIWWWMIMQIFWLLTHLTNGSSFSNWFIIKANQTMKTGYDLIGDSLLPARGFFIFNFLQQFLDFEKIKQIKRKQVELYEKELSNLPANIFQKVPYKNSDKGELIAYPLVLSLETANKTLEKIRLQGLLLNFELDDSQWSRKQKIIYLPLGPHLSDDHLKFVFQAINQLTS